MFYGYRKVPCWYQGSPRPPRGRRDRGVVFILLMIKAGLGTSKLDFQPRTAGQSRPKPPPASAPQARHRRGKGAKVSIVAPFVPASATSCPVLSRHAPRPSVYWRFPDHPSIYRRFGSSGRQWRVATSARNNSSGCLHSVGSRSMLALRHLHGAPQNASIVT